MATTGAFLSSLSLPSRDAYDLPASPRRFPGGGQYRVEIPSVEGPEAFEAVVGASAEYGVPLHRISQGSGIMLQTDAEVRRMVSSAPSTALRSACSPARGPPGISEFRRLPRPAGSAARYWRGGPACYGIEDVRHGCELGLRSVLVADLGQLWVLGRMKQAGDLPAISCQGLGLAAGG